MTVDVCATLFGCKKDIIRLKVAICNKCHVVEVLQASGNLRKDKSSDSLVHRGTIRPVIFKLLFLSQFARQKFYHARIGAISLCLFVIVCYLAEVSELHHQVAFVMTFPIDVLKPDKSFYNIVVFKFAPELHFVLYLVLNLPDAQLLLFVPNIGGL